MDSAESKAPTYHLYGFQVSGKAPKLATADNKIILKCYIKQQQDFYSHFSSLKIYDFAYSLKYFLPAYKGTINLDEKPNIQHDSGDQNKQLHEWLGHVKYRYDMKNQGHKFILMENFLYGMEKQNILDIKIGSRKEKPNKITQSVSKYRIKLNGMLKSNENGETVFLSKYILNQIEDFHQMAKNVAYFFTVNGQLQIKLLQSSFNQLQNFVLSFRSAKGWKYSSASICIVYDTKNLTRTSIKFIDFGRAIYNEFFQNYDQDTCNGAESILKIIQQILQKKDLYKDVQMKKQEKQVVPQKKKIKFKSRDYESGEASSPLR